MRKTRLQELIDGGSRAAQAVLALQVYRARHRATHQEVAIKLLKAAYLEEPHHVARFQRELQLCAKLYH